MPEQLEIKIGHENFANYKRLAYKWWYALAEFVWHAPEEWSSPYESQVSRSVAPPGDAGQLRGLGARRRSEAESEGAQPAANSAGVW